MSEQSKHSPEPWRQGNAEPFDWVEDAGGNIAAESWPGGAGGPDDAMVVMAANARRIVAAVNAVAGISTEALEGGALGDLIKYVRRLMYRPTDVALSDEAWFEQCTTQEANILAVLAQIGTGGRP